MLGRQTVAQSHGQFERLLVVHFFEGSTHAQHYIITDGDCLLLSDKLLGGILPVQRRIQLIQFARTVGCYIVEDDYDSEFRHEGTPVSSLQELEPSRVIYVGTFSKILSPALRLGYLVLPPSLIEHCRSLKRLTDLHSPSLEQLTLARFIEEGHLERQILRTRKIYRKRRMAVINALTTHFPDQVHIHG